MPLLNFKRRKFWTVAAVLLTCFGQPAAVAITINIEYSTDFTGEENPAWDENGLFLISHFQAAKQIWEALLPGPGEISFDFQWDDDIDDPDEPGMTLGAATIELLDTYIEINPLASWFVDLTPLSNEEFGASTQVLYSGLTPAQQGTYFPNTPPPAGLEVGFKLAGPAGMANDFDLLTTIIHEMGHVLGVNGDHSGPYFFTDEHLGGLNSVAVLNDNDSNHLAGDGDLPVLMCHTCGETGVRRLPSATDVLAIARTLDIVDVRLQRVGRIGGGNWNDANAWIGADVPDVTQDAYVHQSGAVTLDTNASVKSLAVSGGGSIDAAGFQLAAVGDVTFDGGAINAGAGAVLRANAFHGDPATLTTAADSTVEFNDFTRGASSATAATFNGNVTIGVGSPAGPVTFNPNAITTWTIGQGLSVGSLLPAKLVIDNGAWTVGGALRVARRSEVLVDAGTVFMSGSFSGGDLTVAGPVEVEGVMTYRGRGVSNSTYTVRGGSVTKISNPPPVRLEGAPGALLTFEDTTQGTAFGASVTSTSITVGGGSGDGGPGGIVTFKGHSHADNAQFVAGAGVGGDSLRISNPVIVAGTGGRVLFLEDSYASGGNYTNHGVDAHGALSSGGETVFGDFTRVFGATFHNQGATLQSYLGVLPAPGGRTRFNGRAKVDTGTFNNYPGQGMGSEGAGITVFAGEASASDSSDEGVFAVYNNFGGKPGAQFGGATEFQGTSTAGQALFYNFHANGVAQNAGSAGNVRFYDGSNAGTATFHNQVGGGAVYFNDTSSAANARIYIEDTGTGTFGGHVVFNGGSKGGMAKIFVRENAFNSTVEFRGTSDAEDAELVFDPGWNGSMLVTNGATLGGAKVDMGSTSGGGLQFRESGKAGSAMIRMRPGANADFTGVNTNAQNATFTLDGATVANGATGSMGFGGANLGNATIYANGGTVSGAAGAAVNIASNANGGTATIIGGGGAVPGAGGARITIDTSSNLSGTQMSVGSGGYLAINGFGAARLGSLELSGSASVFLQQAELRLGSLNTSNTLSGSISGFVNNGNAKITKVGTGTLTLSGANAYYGLTKVDGGTLIINGSTPGPAEVNSGAILGGSGTIGGAVTVNSGGSLSPGTSPGIMTVGSLNMSANSTLQMEIAGSTPGSGYDRIQSTGALAFGGALQVSLVGGFTPADGQSFDLFNWGSRSGVFTTLTLPTLAGLTWDTSQLYSSGVLSISAGVAGDFGLDGRVDGNDFLIWQRGGSPSSNSSVDLAVWKTNFGVGGASPAAATVPEPCSKTLIVSTLAMLVACRRQGRLRSFE